MICVTLQVNPYLITTDDEKGERHPEQAAVDNKVGRYGREKGKRGAEAEIIRPVGFNASNAGLEFVTAVHPRVLEAVQGVEQR